MATMGMGDGKGNGNGDGDGDGGEDGMWMGGMRWR